MIVNLIVFGLLENCLHELWHVLLVQREGVSDAEIGLIVGLICGVLLLVILICKHAFCLPVTLITTVNE